MPIVTAMTSALRAATTDKTPPRRRASWRPHALAPALAMAASLWGATAASAVGISEFSAGITQSMRPTQVTLGPNDDIWFTSIGGSASAVGRVIATGPETGTVTEYPAGLGAIGIALGPDGNMWYVTIAPPGGVGRVTPEGVATDFDTHGVQPQSGIARGPDGNLWFTASVPDPGGDRRQAIARMTTDGSITTFTEGIRAEASLRGIALGPDGNMWFTERNDVVGKITPEGQVTEYSAGIGPNSKPFEITAGPDGAMWFTEATGNRIGRITTSGAITEFGDGITAGSQPTGIALGADGNLWFCEQLGHRIGRITPSGVITEFTGMSANSGPLSMTAGPGGTLWYADSSGRIVRVTIFDTPTATTSATTPIDATSATVHGLVNPNGSTTDAHFEYGTSNTYGTSTPVVTIADTNTTAVGATLSGLTPRTTYFFKLVATNATGTAQSTGSFTTPALPTVTTSAATVKPTTATLNGTVDPEGAQTSAHFEYGTSTDYGTSTSTQTVNAPTAVTAPLSGLTAATTYFFRLVATSASGRSESTGSFTTAPVPVPPTVRANAATNVQLTTVTLSGTVDAEGEDTEAHFDFGLTPEYDRRTLDQTFTGYGATTITNPITALTADTTYYFRLIATNSLGTSVSTGTFKTARTAPPVDTSPAVTPPAAAVPPPAADVSPPAARPSPRRAAAMPAIVKACPLVGITIVGTDAPDMRSGSRATDVIFGLAGNDVLRGMAGADCVFGESGADRIFGGAGADTLLGGDGADVLQGDAGDDAIDGDAGNDQLTGGKNDDSLFGGAGDDRITDGAGIDELQGGAGNDRINARDASAAGRRTADSVSCGAGRDVAVVDRSDRVARDCERVLRR
ncbi:MAG: virginiamycin lyase [Solirubrobacteraceae bacterium]|nr:virginiamycin lyase [Solirubrobacteraceae bacterium]